MHFFRSCEVCRRVYRCARRKRPPRIERAVKERGLIGFEILPVGLRWVHVTILSNDPVYAARKSAAPCYGIARTRSWSREHLDAEGKQDGGLDLMLVEDILPARNLITC